ncbi:MAG: type I-E CRISPR-associated protein Cse1/CasA [Marinomonas sp.]
MNLVKDPWLPMRLEDGSQQVLPMSQISRSDVVDFALPRADFQGAAYQFAIGLLQTVLAPSGQSEWLKAYEAPPSQETLEKAFQKVEHAFHGEGDGPLFMQDFDLLEKQKPTTVSGLLIEAPGENGIKNNTDHFIKRGIGEQMSLEMALVALFTLQSNAPAGGAGHRVGLRGGGPLTTLIQPATEGATLWQKLWFNVINRENWVYDDPDFTDGSVFPWLAPTKLSDKKGTEIYESSVHPLHMFWAMPRRIRLEVQGKSGTCQISGKTTSKLVTEYRTQNYGHNYSGQWAHPLTPYKGDPKKSDAEFLSIKGQPGGIHYKIWDVLTFSSSESAQKCAKAISHFENIAFNTKTFRQVRPRVWVFGYDMDNMKARCWYSTTMPLFQFDPEQQDDLLAEVKYLQKLSSDALWHLRSEIKAAWFEKPGDAKGDMSFIDLEFWQRTEVVFFEAIANLMEDVAEEKQQISSNTAKTWLTKLQCIVLDLFDEYALSELGAERSMIKRIAARRSLSGWLFGGKDIENFKANYKIETQKEVN